MPSQAAGEGSLRARRLAGKASGEGVYDSAVRYRVRDTMAQLARRGCAAEAEELQKSAESIAFQIYGASANAKGTDLRGERLPTRALGGATGAGVARCGFLALLVRRTAAPGAG